MDWVAAEFPPRDGALLPDEPVHPLGPVGGLSRRSTGGCGPGRCGRPQEYMANLGLEGFTQERTSAQREYTPPFDLTGVAGEGGAL